jgi:hypothetical protein
LKTWLRHPRVDLRSQIASQSPIEQFFALRAAAVSVVQAGGAVMSDEFHFNGEDDAKAEIRAAVRYLLEGARGSDRGDIVQEVIAIVNEVARGLPSGGHDRLDDGMPGG